MLFVGCGSFACPLPLTWFRLLPWRTELRFLFFACNKRGASDDRDYVMLYMATKECIKKGGPGVDEVEGRSYHPRSVRVCRRIFASPNDISSTSDQLMTQSRRSPMTFLEHKMILNNYVASKSLTAQWPS